MQPNKRDAFKKWYEEFYPLGGKRMDFFIDVFENYKQNVPEPLQVSKNQFAQAITSEIVEREDIILVKWQQKGRKVYATYDKDDVNIDDKKIAKKKKRRN